MAGRNNVRNMFTAETDTELHAKEFVKRSYAAQLNEQMKQKEEQTRLEKERKKEQERKEHEAFLKFMEEEKAAMEKEKGSKKKKQEPASVPSPSSSDGATSTTAAVVIPKLSLSATVSDGINQAITSNAPNQTITPRSVETQALVFSRFRVDQMTVEEKQLHSEKLQRQRDTNQLLQSQIDERNRLRLSLSSPIPPETIGSGNNEEWKKTLTEQRNESLQSIKLLRQEVEELRKSRGGATALSATVATPAYQKPNFKLPSVHRRRQESSLEELPETDSVALEEVEMSGQSTSFVPVPESTVHSPTKQSLRSTSNFIPVGVKLPSPQKRMNISTVKTATTVPSFPPQQQSGISIPQKKPNYILSNNNQSSTKTPKKDELDQLLLKFVNKTGKWASS